MSTVNERFMAVRKDLGFNQQQFASELGISRTHISGIENEKDNPSLSLLKLLCAKFTINEEWLIEGIGTPLPEWDMANDEGVFAKYSERKVFFEKALRGSTGEDLISMVESFCFLTGTLDTGKLDQEELTVYHKAICSVMNELETLAIMVSADLGQPAKNDALGWVKFKNSCTEVLARINESVKQAANVYLGKHGEEMKL